MTSLHVVTLIAIVSHLSYMSDAAVLSGIGNDIYRVNAYRNFNIYNNDVMAGGCSVVNGELFINGRSRGRLTSAQQQQLTTFQRSVSQWSGSLRNRILQVVQAGLSGGRGRVDAAVPFPSVPTFCYNY
uniref:Pepsin inhibitor-3-like repeated domain-containing protein n=1 Tax=Parascaris univalens TaxID=6257 RepID=A0A914ZTF5_PARUN